MARYIGKEMSRVDGVAKVTGKAKYAAEFAVPNLAYGFVVSGSVAKGSIASIDTQEAERVAGRSPHLHTPEHTEVRTETAETVRRNSRTNHSARSSRRGSSLMPSRWRSSSPRLTRRRASQRAS